MHIRNAMLSEKLAFAITEMVVNGRECRPSASEEQFSCIAFAYQPPSSSSTRRDLCNAQQNPLCIRAFGIITAGMRPLCMLWGKRNLIYTNRIIYAHSAMGTAFPFISLQEGLILDAVHPWHLAYIFYNLIYQNIALTLWF